MRGFPTRIQSRCRRIVVWPWEYGGAPVHRFGKGLTCRLGPKVPSHLHTLGAEEHRWPDGEYPANAGRILRLSEAAGDKDLREHTDRPLSGRPGSSRSESKSRPRGGRHARSGSSCPEQTPAPRAIPCDGSETLPYRSVSQQHRLRCSSQPRTAPLSTCRESCTPYQRSTVPSCSLHGVRQHH